MLGQINWSGTSHPSRFLLFLSIVWSLRFLWWSSCWGRTGWRSTIPVLQQNSLFGGRVVAFFFICFLLCTFRWIRRISRHIVFQHLKCPGCVWIWAAFVQTHVSSCAQPQVHFTFCHIWGHESLYQSRPLLLPAKLFGSRVSQSPHYP